MSRHAHVEAPAGEAAVDAGVAESLERLRAAVRQRQAEVAVLEASLDELPASLAAVERRHRLTEPTWAAEGGARWALRLQRVLYHLVAKRPHRSLLRQQTEFNRSVSLALRDLADRQQRIADALREIGAAGDTSGRDPDV